MNTIIIYIFLDVLNCKEVVESHEHTYPELSTLHISDSESKDNLSISKILDSSHIALELDNHKGCSKFGYHKAHYTSELTTDTA